MDAIDAVLVELGPESIQLLAHHSHALPTALRARLDALCTPGEHLQDAVDLLGSADRQLGEVLAEAATALLEKAAFPHSRVQAIGSHGQTIRHRPPDATTEWPFSLQIGDPNVLAARTGIPVVADFRRRDLASGGQGAPLVPPFHHAAFRDAECVRAIVNIGGISNITLLPKDGAVLGFDAGPGNRLMDAWIQRHLGRPFDADGSWAAAHEPHPELLAHLQTHPFLARQPPKSTGREDFHLDWVDSLLAQGPPIAAGRVQATLLEFSATAIASALIGLSPAVDEIYLCGGGACNEALVERLRHLLQPRPVATTAALGLAPEWVEGVAFAWLARETLLGRCGNLPSVTGATQAAVLGAIHQP